MENEIKNINVGIVSDQRKKEDNIKNNKPLCMRCGGTGNELFFMYRKYKKCGGTGVKNETK